ncbi:L-rhamnose isomerase [Christensenellaceae bacterium OttesenSCG-928-M15]|nr:L-rhamnose isomerase [Christensenellaceae bacterium OttesenSCG-928-M15]
MNEKQTKQAFEYAKDRYAAIGVNVLSAMERVDMLAVSMHCWQGDDVLGFDGTGELTGGIATTGNYPGRARTPEELRADIDMAMTLIPGKTKLNLHACYAEKNGKKVDRDAYTVSEFQSWIDWAKGKGVGLDFNPTFFSHPMMDENFSLASRKDAVRRFWIEHGKRCREIGEAIGKALGTPCVVNYWMPDGFKDTCVNTAYYRDLMTKSLDEIFSVPVDERFAPCAIESKLFGVGVESYTVASHEYALGYAIRNKKLYTLDAGHFHPTEHISAKISAVLMSLEKVLLHVSRGVRWDSDHVITWDDELQRIMDEILFNNYDKRVYIGLDYFDASINRIAAWAIGMRNARKAILSAALAPLERMKKAEADEDYALRLALLEERKTMPIGVIWEYYCMTRGVPAGQEWIERVQAYERDVLSKR